MKITFDLQSIRAPIKIIVVIRHKDVQMCLFQNILFSKVLQLSFSSLLVFVGQFFVKSAANLWLRNSTIEEIASDFVSPATLHPQIKCSTTNRTTKESENVSIQRQSCMTYQEFGISRFRLFYRVIWHI